MTNRPLALTTSDLIGISVLIIRIPNVQFGCRRIGLLVIFRKMVEQVGKEGDVLNFPLATDSR